MLKSLPRLAMKQDTGGRKYRRAPTAETGKSGQGVASRKSPQRQLAMRASTAEISWLSGYAGKLVMKPPIG